MKSTLYLIYIFFMFSVCTPEKKTKKNEENPIDLVEKREKDSIMYQTRDKFWWEECGVYTTPNNLSLNICVYNNQETNTIKVPEVQIKHLLETKVLPRFMQYKNNMVEIPYNDTVVRGTKQPICYYEITNIKNSTTPKVIGRLYEIACRYEGLNLGYVFISDTTAQYGWFVIDFPKIFKPPSDYTTPIEWKVPHITSLHPKAKPLIGEIKKEHEKPLRIIRNEEITKNKSK